MGIALEFKIVPKMSSLRFKQDIASVLYARQ